MHRVAFQVRTRTCIHLLDHSTPADHCPIAGFENHKHGTRNDSSFDSKDQRSATPVEEDCHKQIKYNIIKEVIDGRSVWCNGQAGRDLSCKAHKEYPQTYIWLIRPPSPEENQDRN